MKPGTVQTSTAILAMGFLVCFCAPGCMAQGELPRPTNPGAGTRSFTLTVGGLERSYIVHVPSSYSLRKQLSAVVIMFHGGGGTARAAMWETGWAEKAEKVGFLAVFPNAMSRDPAQPSSFAGNPQLWNDGPGSNGAEVIYVTVPGLGHTWAGGRSLLPEIMVGKSSDTIRATDVIWDFFEKHPMK